MNEQQFEHPDIVLCPGGPMLVRGITSVQDEQGHIHAVERPVVALCRCHKSSRLPWCDGTHKAIPRSPAAPQHGLTLCEGSGVGWVPVDPHQYAAHLLTYLSEDELAAGQNVLSGQDLSLRCGADLQDG